MGYVGGGICVCVGVGRITNRRQRFPFLLLEQVHCQGIIFPPSGHCDLWEQIAKNCQDPGVLAQ